MSRTASGGAAIGQPRILVAVEAYFPDEAGTPFLITELVRALARSGVAVTVLTSTPGSATDEGGVEVVRAGSSRQPTRRIVVRGFRMLHSAFALARRVRSRARTVDAMYVVVGPTLLPTFVALALTGLRGRPPLVAVVHDLYPDAAVAAGALRTGSLVARAWRVATRILFRQCHAIIALGDDMRRTVAAAYPGAGFRLNVVPHWSVGKAVRRLKRADSSECERHGLGTGFIVQYAGNIGLTHGIATVLDGARRVAVSPIADRVRFVFFGSGAAADLVREVESQPGSLVRYLGVRPRSAQTDFLACCDVTVIGYAPGMVGVSVPSRTVSVLASGRPIIAITDMDSDLGCLVRDHDLGWVVPPGDGAAFAEAVRSAFEARDQLGAMGDRVEALSFRLDSVEVAARRYLQVALGP